MLPIIFSTIESDDDRQFMERLYEDYFALMRKEARRYCNDDFLVEDMIQQTCVRLIDYLQIVQNLACCKRPAYIVCIVRSVCIDHLRRNDSRLTRSFAEQPEGYEETLSDDADLEGEVLRRIGVEELMRAIQKLPERERYLLDAKYLLEQSDACIAATLGIQRASVRQYLTRARRRALALIEGRENDV